MQGYGGQCLALAVSCILILVNIDGHECYMGQVLGLHGLDCEIACFWLNPSGPNVCN